MENKPGNERTHLHLKKPLSTGGRILVGILLVFGAFLIIPLALVLAWSPGTVRPYVDADGGQIPGSISEKRFVSINGIDQGMFIKSVNRNNPVLLFIHGGLGMPEYFLNEKYPVGLEKHFTVCWWERRGAGLSYSPNLSAAEVTVEQLVSDTIGVTDYLRERFGRERIFLMGHSGGSLIGIRAAAKTPEKYEAYIGIGQMANQVQSEKLSYRYMLERYAETGNTKMIRRLERFPILESDGETRLSYFFSLARDIAMHDLGVGTMRNMKSIFTGIILPFMQCGDYTLGEKINLWRGKAFLQNSTNLGEEMLTADPADKITNLHVPVYFISGIYDYTVSYTLSKRYLDKIEAPSKGFYTFRNSAHSPLFEEPEAFREIMIKDVLHGKTTLADGEQPPSKM